MLEYKTNVLALMPFFLQVKKLYLAKFIPMSAVSLNLAFLDKTLYGLFSIQTNFLCQTIYVRNVHNSCWTATETLALYSLFKRSLNRY